MRNSGVTIAVLIAGLAICSETFGSYRMFCELSGTVVSAAAGTEYIEFDYLVEQSDDIELEGIGSGAADCHAFSGQQITVVMARDDAGNLGDITVGNRIRLQRFDIDVIDRQTGSITRSVKYVRKAD